LEGRSLLTTTLYLNFGAGISDSLATTVEEFRNINGTGIGGKGTGTDLTEDNIIYSLTDPLEFVPLNYDFNGVGGFNQADIVAQSRLSSGLWSPSILMWS